MTIIDFTITFGEIMYFWNCLVFSYLASYSEWSCLRCLFFLKVIKKNWKCSCRFIVIGIRSFPNTQYPRSSLYPSKPVFIPFFLIHPFRVKKGVEERKRKISFPSHYTFLVFFSPCFFSFSFFCVRILVCKCACIWPLFPRMAISIRLMARVSAKDIAKLSILNIKY